MRITIAKIIYNHPTIVLDKRYRLPIFRIKYKLPEPTKMRKTRGANIYVVKRKVADCPNGGMPLIIKTTKSN